jgi:multicomponent Na+:H+ antiporter subunit E
VTRGDRLGRAALAGWLAAMWVLLWGEVTAQNVANGVILGAILTVLVPPSTLGDDPVTMRIGPALSFAVWFAKALVLSNVAVAKEVLAPSERSGIRPAVIAVRLRTRSGRLATVIANAITLTPGTMTVDARGRPPVLFIHVMSYENRESVIDDVIDLERRVVDAFGTAEERAAICGDSSGPNSEVAS